MKELSIEEKAKRYDEALAKAAKIHRNYKGRVRAVDIVIEEVFPELKESEDERIREALIEMVHDTTGDELWVDYNVHKEDAIAWLEKQGDQKPVIEMKTPEESLGIDSDTYNKIVDECIYGDDEQKPAWSKEDEHRVNDTIYFLDTAKKHYASTIELDACIEWLKSLRPKKQWKPSELQIEALESATANCAYSEYEDCLRELIGQLKKLREE